MLKNSFKNRLYNIFFDDKDTVVCPNCKTPNTPGEDAEISLYKSIKKEKNSKTEHYLSGSKILETISCRVCLHEWIRKVTLKDEREESN